MGSLCSPGSSPTAASTLARFQEEAPDPIAAKEISGDPVGPAYIHENTYSFQGYTFEGELIARDYSDEVFICSSEMCGVVATIQSNSMEVYLAGKVRDSRLDIRKVFSVGDLLKLLAGRCKDKRDGWRSFIVKWWT